MRVRSERSRSATLWPGVARWRRGRGCLCEPGVQPGPDLLRGVGAAAALGACDHYPGGRDARERRQAEYLPPAHLPRLRLCLAARAGAAPAAGRADGIHRAWRLIAPYPVYELVPGNRSVPLRCEHCPPLRRSRSQFRSSRQARTGPSRLTSHDRPLPAFTHSPQGAPGPCPSQTRRPLAWDGSDEDDGQDWRHCGPLKLTIRLGRRAGSTLPVA
jgi:hypothetical protein